MPKKSQETGRPCTVCGQPARAKGLCWRHYAAQRRATPAAKQRESGTGVVLPPIKLDHTMDMLMRAAVELEGITLATWVRKAIGERILRQSIKHPELRRIAETE